MRNLAFALQVDSQQTIDFKLCQDLSFYKVWTRGYTDPFQINEGKAVWVSGTSRSCPQISKEWLKDIEKV
jgi:hypothetical protein